MMITAVLWLVAAGLAQQNPPPTPGPQEDLTIQVNVNLIQVDVTVIDKSGKHVPDLTADDFEVARDGKKQAIKKVLYVTPPRAPVEPPPIGGTATGPMLTANLPSKQIAAKDVRRTIAIYIDDLSISFANLVYTREALKKFVQQNVVAGDVVAIYRSSGGLGLLQQFTTDKRLILEAIERLRFRNLNGLDSMAPINANPLEESGDATLAQMALEQRLQEEVQLRERQDMLTAGMLSTASFIVRGLRELPGRKSMVIFSESITLSDRPQSMNNPNMSGDMRMAPGSMGGNRNRTLQQMNALIDIANRSGVTFYTVDPRGLVYFGATAADSMPANPRNANARTQQRQMDFFSSQDGMSVLAEETGGLFFSNTNDLGKALAEAANDQDGYYLIAFQPDDDTFEKTRDGQAKTHKLTIKVRKSGVKVRYRKSFVGVPDSERVPANPNPMVSALSSPFRSVEVSMKLTPIYMDDPKSGPFLRAFLFVDPKTFQFVDEPAAPEDKDKSPWKKATMNELVVLYDQTGRAVEQVSNSHTIRMRKDGYERVMKNGLVQVLTIPIKKPGPYQLRAAVMDEGTRKTGSSTQFVNIPDLKTKQLAMSDLALSSEAFLQSQSTDGAPGLRVLHPGDQLIYGAYVYNAKMAKDASTPNIESQVILYRDGKAVYTGKKTPYRPADFAEGKPLSIMGNMSLGGKIPPGEYVLQVAVRDLEAPKKQQFAVRSIDFEVKP